MLYLNCEKEILLEGLNLVSRTVPNRTTLPILECVLLNADRETGLRITANDLEMSIETKALPAEVIEEGAVALDARLLAEIVRKMPGEYIEIKTGEDSMTQLVSGKARFNIMGQPGEDFPVMPEMEKSAGYTMNAALLRDMIRQTIFSVATDETKPILTGELLQYKDGELIIVAVDGFRISYRGASLTQSESAARDIRVVVPAKSLNELSRALPSDGEDEVTFYINDKRVLFELPRFTFMSRLLEGEFIRYDQIFNEDFTTIVTAERLPLLNGLERACLIARDTRKSPVKLEIKEDSVIITSNTEMGQSYDEVYCDIDGQNMEIAFNPRYLIDALRALEEERLVIKFTTPLSPCIIRNVESDGFKYLILPLRLRN